MGIALSEKINVQTNIRYIVSEKHLIFYTVDEDYISVMRILDSRTNYLQVIFGYNIVQ
jgi:plasmid stabilization system protein ParE